MTDPRTPDPRSPDDDSRLAALLSDAVSDVEPREALDSIRNRTKVTPLSARRPWTYAVGGAVVATAVVIGAIAFAGDQLGLTGSDDVPAASHDPRHTPGRGHTSSPSHVSSSATSVPSASPVTSSSTLAGYYLGDTPQGPRLYREFDQVSGAVDPVDGALQLLTTAPHDADYATPWKPGDFADGSVKDDEIVVVVADSLAERPAGMSEQYAREAVQQVVYTLQAAAQSRLPVRFSLDTVLGVDTSEPVANASPIDVLALVSISDPAEGATVGGSFTASGVASSFEANVPWEIRQGDQVVKSGFATAEGWMDKLYPWQADVDVSDLAPGDYTFVAKTDDPSGGEGGGPHVDTRTITIR